MLLMQPFEQKGKGRHTNSVLLVVLFISLIIIDGPAAYPILQPVIAYVFEKPPNSNVFGYREATDVNPGSYTNSSYISSDITSIFPSNTFNISFNSSFENTFPVGFAGELSSIILVFCL